MLHVFHSRHLVEMKVEYHFLWPHDGVEEPRRRGPVEDVNIVGQVNVHIPAFSSINPSSFFKSSIQDLFQQIVTLQNSGSYFAHWWLKMDLALHLF